MTIDDIIRNGILLRTLEGAIGWLKRDECHYVAKFLHMQINLIDNRGMNDDDEPSDCTVMLSLELDHDAALCFMGRAMYYGDEMPALQELADEVRLRASESKTLRHSKVPLIERFL